MSHSFKQDRLSTPPLTMSVGSTKESVGRGQSRLSCGMALLTHRRSFFLAVFAATLALLSTVVPTWLITWPALAVIAAYLANWGVALAAVRMPSSYLPDIEKYAVLITGCDSGFGLEMATRLDTMGATVFACVLNPKSAGVIQLTSTASNRLTIIPMNVTSDKDVANAVSVVTEKIGDKKLQAVVNNAGVSAVTEVEWCPVDTYRQVLEVNALGPIRVTQAFLPLLRGRNEGGRVIIVASLAGRYTFPGFTAYSMSKCAAVSFADGLRREMRKWSISVHTVEPTLYRTPLSATEQVQCMMQKHWDRSPDTIKSTYGEEYFEAFKAKILLQLQRAKPPSQITEVVDDMIDAVFGVEPKMRYVPSVAAQFRAQLITAMPMPLQDYLLCQAQPSTPPAAMTKRNIASRRLSHDHGTGRKTLQRLRSVPTWFLRHNSQEENKPPASNFFQYPDTNSKPPSKKVIKNDSDTPPSQQEIEQIQMDNPKEE